MTKYPLVTIGIPNYNYGHYILEALESAVNQTYPNLEILVVDDCSTDNSIEIIEKWLSEYRGNVRIELIKNKQNKGLSKICNLILNKCRGIYFQILDADDIFKNDKLINQVSVMNEAETIALVYSNMMLIDELGQVKEEDYFTRIRYNENAMPSGMVFKELFDFNFIPYPLIRTKLAREVGGFDESQQVHDYYLWLKLAERYEIRYCPGKYAYYRIHEFSMSNSRKTNIISLENVLNTKYRYWDGGNNYTKTIIKRDILNSVTTLYKYNFPSADCWLFRNLKVNPGIKSFIYYVSFKIGIPFEFFNKLKKIFPDKSPNRP